MEGTPSNVAIQELSRACLETGNLPFAADLAPCPYETMCVFVLAWNIRICIALHIYKVSAGPIKTRALNPTQMARESCLAGDKHISESARRALCLYAYVVVTAHLWLERDCLGT